MSDPQAAKSLAAALQHGVARATEWMLTAPSADAAHALRVILLASADALPAALVPDVIPVASRDFPLLDAAGAPDSLAEEWLLLRAVYGDRHGVATPEIDRSRLRLGWGLSISTELRTILVPWLAVDLLAGKWSPENAEWDRRAASASTVSQAALQLLKSPVRILALSPNVILELPALRNALDDVVDAAWKTPLLREVEETIAGVASRHGNGGVDRLLNLVRRAASSPEPRERLEVNALQHAQATGASEIVSVAELLLLVARSSPFFGADDDLWASRLHSSPSGKPNGVQWSAGGSEGVRWLEWALLRELRELVDHWEPLPEVEEWLRGVAARTLNEAERSFESSATSHPEAAPLRARQLLAGFRRPWLQRLPQKAREETLGLLLDIAGMPLSSLDWVVAALAEPGAAASEVVAEAWRKRRGGGEGHELRAFLSIHAFPSLTEGEREESLHLANEIPAQWRVGILVLLTRAAHQANDSAVAVKAAEALLELARSATLAVPAAIGLLQLVRQEILSPPAEWRERIEDALPTASKTDGRVAREMDLARQ